MEDEPLDIAVMEPFGQAVEGARDEMALRGAMDLQDMPLESLDIALNLRSEKLIGPRGKVIEGFAEPSILRRVADGNPSDGLAGAIPIAPIKDHPPAIGDVLFMSSSAERGFTVHCLMHQGGFHVPRVG
jgi:hypothetical protein